MMPKYYGEECAPWRLSTDIIVDAIALDKKAKSKNEIMWDIKSEYDMGTDPYLIDKFEQNRNVLLLL